MHGGSEVQLYQLAKKIAEDERFDVSFVVGDFGQENIELYDNISIFKAFPIKRKEFKYITGFYYQLKFLFLLKRINADVYIQRAAGAETGLVAFFSKLFEKKFIYMTASSIDVDGTYKKRDLLTGFIYEYGLKNASIVIVQGEEYKQILKERYKRDSVIIKNSFRIPEHAPNISKKKTILWVGTSQLLKQPEIFLEMAKNMPQERFVMIMPKHNLNLWDNIKREVENIPNIEFIEKVPFEEIDSYFAEAKLFVNTSTFEGFPNTFVQAMMNSAPIASLNVNPDNFLEKYHCGFCAKKNVDDLISFARDILKNNERWQHECANAFKYAKENHDINKIVNNLLLIIEK